MNFDPRLLIQTPGQLLLADMVVVEQEYIDAGHSFDDAEAIMNDAAIRASEDPSHPPITAETIAALIGVYPPTQEQIDEAKAAIAGAAMAHSLGPGFQAFAEANNLKPLSDEFYVNSDQVSFCMTDGGLMVYTKDDNTVRLLPPKA